MAEESKYHLLLSLDLGPLDLALLRFLREHDIMSVKQITEHPKWEYGTSHTYRSVKKIAPLLIKTWDGKIMLDDSKIPSYDDFKRNLMNTVHFLNDWDESFLESPERWKHVSNLQESLEIILSLIRISRPLLTVKVRLR